MKGDIEIEIKVEGNEKERAKQLFDALNVSDTCKIKTYNDKDGVVEYKGCVWSKTDTHIDLLVYTSTDDKCKTTLFIYWEDIREAKRVINTIIEGCKRP